MSRTQAIVLAVIFFLITALLLPISINISTSYLGTVSPQLESWVKEHIIWFWVATVLSSLLGLILVGISAWAPIPILPSGNELDDITTKVNMAVSIANNDPMLKNQSNKSSMLNDWKGYAQTLIQTYKNYKTSRDRKARFITNSTVELIEKLIKSTKRSFLFLQRKNDFIEIAKSAYEVVYEQRRWKDAADLAYEIGRLSHELGRHTESNDWIDPLKTCLRKANFHGYWIKAYNGMEPDSPGALDEPSDVDARKNFHEALVYAVKLYDLEGLNKSNDQEAQKYFEKALIRANNLPDKIWFSWIKIHIGELAPRLDRQSVTKHYIDALAPLDVLDMAILDALTCSDIVNLKLICYDELGKLALPDLSTGHSGTMNWYQKQLELAEKYGRLDFQGLAHLGLANSSFLQGLTQPSLPAKLQHFHDAYEHIKKGWVVNKDFSKEGPRAVDRNELVQLMIDVADQLIKAP